jgi:hypothetical protein
MAEESHHQFTMDIREIKQLGEPKYGLNLPATTAVIAHGTTVLKAIATSHIIKSLHKLSAVYRRSKAWSNSKRRFLKNGELSFGSAEHFA